MMSENLDTLLLKLPVFAKLTSRERADLEKMAVMKICAEGEFLAMQGDIWPYVFILMAGEISAQKFSSAGRSLGAWRLTHPEVFWSPSTFDGE